MSLTASGRQDAAQIARRLTELGWTPEAVLSSDSRRTRETWEIMATALTAAPEPRFSHALYCGGPDDIWTEAHHLAAEAEAVLVLGHNPGWGRALHQLTGATGQLTPASAALLEGQGDTWPEALEDPWQLVELMRPG